MTLSQLWLAPGAMAWTSDTAVNTAVCVDPDEQDTVAIAADGAGGVFVAWADERGGGEAVYIQHLDAAGSPQWAACGVLVSASAATRPIPKVLADGAGGVIVLWLEAGLRAQRFAANGTASWASGGVVVSSFGALAEWAVGNFHLVSDGSNGAVIAWEAPVGGANGEDVYAQRLDGAGNLLWGAAGLAIAASAAYEVAPVLVGDGAGGAIVAWADNHAGSGMIIYGQRVAPGGTLLWAAAGVPLSAAGVGSLSPRITADGAGGAIVTWLVEGMEPRILAQRVTGTGTVLWTAGGVEVRATTDYLFYHSVVGDGAGGAIVAWSEQYGPVIGSQQTAFAQRLDGNGVRQWPSLGVPVAPTQPYYFYTNIIPLVADGAGGAILVTEYSPPDGDSDISAHRVAPDGSLPWGTGGSPVSTAGAAQLYPVAASDGDGGVIVAWVDYRNGDQGDVYAQRVDAEGGASGLAQPVNLTPPEGATTDATPTLTASPFEDGSGLLAHAASQWRVNESSNLTPDIAVGERRADNDFLEGLSLPFAFPFYGRTITAIAVGTNGMIELLEDGESSIWVGFPGAHALGVYVGDVDAVFASNDDLDTSDGYLRVYDNTTHVIVEWLATTIIDGSVASYPVHFQVVLYPSGQIRWNFEQMDFVNHPYDLFSGVYPRGGTEVEAGYALDSGESRVFEPATSTVGAVTYAWEAPGTVLYDSGETAVDLTAHSVPVAAGLGDGETYYWGVRYRADNGEWTRWSAATSFLVDDTPPATRFADVPATYWAYTYIEALAASGITGGCGNGNFCPDATVTRAQMAVFLERGMRGSGYSPPMASGTFADVPASYWAAAWIERLAADAITVGCGNGNFCPDEAVSRDQMAVFLERAMGWPGIVTPAPATGTMFADVPATYWAAAWVERLATDGITAGCGEGNYCPSAPVTRAQMAVFLVRAFGL